MTAHNETKAGHTPGPWVEFADGGKTVAIMPAGRDGDVCIFADPVPSANDARLIAAAPDMFDVLWLVKELHSYTGEDASGFAAMVDSRIDAALARATSEAV